MALHSDVTTTMVETLMTLTIDLDTELLLEGEDPQFYALKGDVLEPDYNQQGLVSYLDAAIGRSKANPEHYEPHDQPALRPRNESPFTGYAYENDYYNPLIFVNYMTGKAKLPKPDASLPYRGTKSRAVAEGVKNIRGKPKKCHRKDITWNVKLRIIARYKELRALIDAAVVANLKELETPPHKDYETKFIMAYLRFWQMNATRDAYRSFPIDNLSQVARWVKASQSPNFVYTSSTMRIRKRGSDSHKVVEALLVEWFNNMREENRKITWRSFTVEANKICAKERDWCVANQIEPSIKTDTVSNGFLENVVKRNKIVLKSIKRQTKLSEAERTEKTQKLLEHVHRVRPHVDAVGNFDEVAVSESGVLSKSKTLTHASDNQVVVDCDANDNKRIGTLIPVAVAKKITNEDGTIEWQGILLTTFLIYIGEPVQGRVLNETYFEGVEVLWSKCGVMTSCEHSLTVAI